MMNDFDYVLSIINPWIEKYLDHGVAALSAKEIVGVGVWLLEAEVNNGGFDQYYFNSAGELAVPTIEALRTIGAHCTASLLTAANAEFPNAVPSIDRNLRQEQLDAIRSTARFNALEEAFYQGTENLTTLLALYLRKAL